MTFSLDSLCAEMWSSQATSRAYVSGGLLTKYAPKHKQNILHLNLYLEDRNNDMIIIKSKLMKIKNMNVVWPHKAFHCLI
jgi:hypothetical protein